MPGEDRGEAASRAYVALLQAVPLTEALLFRMTRDPWLKVGDVPYERLRAQFSDVWASPETHLHLAAPMAALLARLGVAPSGLVLPVQIAVHDEALPEETTGWEGWRAMDGAHGAIRDVLTEMRDAYEWQPGELEAAHDGLLYRLATDTPEHWHYPTRIGSRLAQNEWDGQAPRSISDYAERPEDFPPGTALAFVWEVRRSLEADACVADWLTAIELAASSTLDRPVQQPRASLDDSASARSVPGIGHVSEKWWTRIEQDGLLEEYYEQEDEQDVDTQTGADILGSLPPGERVLLEAMLALQTQGKKATAPALAKALGKESDASTLAAIRQTKRRVWERVAASRRSVSE